MSRKGSVIVVSFILLLGYLLEFGLYYYVLEENEALQRGWFWLSLALTPVLIGILVYVVMQRFQELNEEEKDDLSQY